MTDVSVATVRRRIGLVPEAVRFSLAHLPQHFRQPQYAVTLSLKYTRGFCSTWLLSLYLSGRLCSQARNRKAHRICNRMAHHVTRRSLRRLTCRPSCSCSSAASCSSRCSTSTTSACGGTGCRSAGRGPFHRRASQPRTPTRAPVARQLSGPPPGIPDRVVPVAPDVPEDADAFGHGASPICRRYLRQRRIAASHSRSVRPHWTRSANL